MIALKIRYIFYYVSINISLLFIKYYDRNNKHFRSELIDKISKV